MASRELDGIQGYHNVKNTEAREIMSPYLKSDGHYILRPSTDSKGGVLCTICVTNKSKLVNYRLVKDVNSGTYYIHNNTSFNSLQQLIAYYKDTPINSAVNTRLLLPVVPQQQQQTAPPALPGRQMPPKPQKSVKRPLPPQPQDSGRSDRLNGGDDNYVTMQKKSDNVSTNPTSPANDNNIPGLHEYLPKTEINSVMAPYLHKNGSYLVRPSASMEGQLTLAVCQSGKVWNFKINCEGSEYFIAPKRRFGSATALLESYRSMPIKSKKAANEKIFLLHPVPVDPIMEQKHKAMLEEKAARKSVSNLKAAAAPPNDSLPPPWQEHFNEQYKKKYFYNPETGESVWDRPKPVKPATTNSLAPATTNSLAPALPGRRGKSMKERPLPSAPGSMSSSVPATLPSRQREPLPVPPQQNGVNQPSGRFPPLPPKENTTPTHKRDHPPLPPKEDTSPNSKSHPPLPPKESGGGAVNPPLPPKEAGPRHTLATPGPPALPTRASSNPQRPSPSPSSSTTSANSTRPPLPVPGQGSFPPLPPKESSPGPSMPPLPPKSNEPALPPTINKFPPKKEKRVVEYEDTVVGSSNRSKSPAPPAREAGPVPPLPPSHRDISPPPTGGLGSGPPAPPPPPIITPPANVPAPPPAAGGGGVPAPPPPPPMMPPPPSPSPVRATRAETFSSPGMKRSDKPSPPIDTGSGRPFGAGDLQEAKTLLRRRSEAASAPEPPRQDLGGIGSALSNAFDSKIKSIRGACQESDSDSEYDDPDDDDEWDD